MPLTIVDAGSRGGLHPRWNRVADRIRVFAVDADDEAEAPPAPYPVEIRPVALAGGYGSATLYLTRKADCSSLLRPNRAVLDRFPDAQRYDIVREIPLETVPLSAVEAEPDFLKLDIHGVELEVLQGGGAVVDHLLGVEVETCFAPIWTGQALFPDVHAFMTARGFVLADLARSYWQRLDGGWQLMYGDALFLRDRALVAPSRLTHLDTIETAYGYKIHRPFVRGAHRIAGWLSAFTYRGPYSADRGLGR